MNKNRNSRISKIAIVAMCAALLVGCGTESKSNSVVEVDFGKATLASCLRSSGATFAKSIDDLDFLSQAEAEDTASRFGFTYDQSTKLFVDLWEDGDTPREWLMWVAQPFEDDLTPFQIVESGSSDSYVAYMVNPSFEQRRAVESCTE